MNKDMVLILRDDGHELQTAEYTARYDRDGKRTIAMGLYEKSPFSFRVEKLTEDKSTGWAIGVKNGEVFIKDAFIGSGIVTSHYSGKLDVADNKGNKHAACMALGVEGDQSKVVFEADRFAVIQNAESLIRNAIENVRQSRVFEQLLEASQVQQAEALAAAVRDEIERQCQPGGLIWRAAR
ncbi:phage tail tip fiber protein [Enterobacter kobei]|uniref:phage tail tip fiber protein n=1 Tax=Enterobacter kobei TaxID=208224 RepID=UPI00292AA124|nr:DUF1983 domain-containing protein [Enterobacter kobei]MDV1941083.1 DUF1983 domain-containing protein [Enterobacter kobei]